MDIINKIKFSFKDQEELFKLVKNENIKQSVYFFLTLLLPNLALTIILGGSYISEEFMLAFSIGIGEIIVWTSLMTIFSIIGFLIYSSLIYGFSKIVKGKGTFKDSAKLIIYSLTPYLLISWIPISSIAKTMISLAALFFFIKINVEGAKSLMKLSKGRSIALTTFHYLLILLLTVVPKLVLG
jgi:hypothetical protein